MDLSRCVYCYSRDIVVVISTVEGDEEFPLCVTCHSAFDLGLELAVPGHRTRVVMPHCEICGERFEERHMTKLLFGLACPDCATEYEVGDEV